MVEGGEGRQTGCFSQGQSGKVNHYLCLTPHTRTHTSQVASILPVSTNLHSHAHTHTHTAAEERNGWGGGGHEGNSSRGKEGLFMVPYFLSQHPLSSQGKSIPKGQGSPWRHFFCSQCHAVYVQPCVCACVHVSLALSPLVHKNVWSFSR